VNKADIADFAGFFFSVEFVTPKEDSPRSAYREQTRAHATGWRVVLLFMPFHFVREYESL
jgi:hypothetical protein